MRQNNRTVTYLAAGSLAGIFVALTAGVLTACSSSSPATASGGGVATLGAAVSKAMTTVAKNSPHVVPSATVTAHYEAARTYFRNFLGALLPEAKANSVSALSTIWDLESGAPPAGTDLALINTYFGGGLYGCDGSNNPQATTGGTSCHSTFYYEWTGPSGTGTKVPTNVSAKSYMGQQLDPDFVNSNGASVTTFGRMKLALGIPCALANIFPHLDADGTPSVSSNATVTFPTDTTSTIYKSTSDGGCGMDTSMAGGSLSGVVVEAVTGSTLYNKKLTLTPPGGHSNSVWLGIDLAAGKLNFMSIEDQADSEGRNAVDRVVMSGTGLGSAATTVIKYEYASIGFVGTRNSSAACWSGSQWNCDFEFHRVFIDGANDVSYILSNNGDPGDLSGQVTQNTPANAPTRYVQFSAAGKPIELGACTAGSCSETLAMSLGMTGQYTGAGGSATTPNDYNGCINAGSLAITTDDTLACAITGTSVNSGSVTAAIETSREFYAGVTAGVPDLLSSDKNSTVSFTDGTDMYTAATVK